DLGAEAERIGRAVHVASLDAAAGEPGRETPVVVIAAIDAARVRTGRRQLDRRRAAEFAAPDDERVVEHAALLEVPEQGADRLIALPGEAAMIDLEVVVVVPRLPLAMPDLDEAHAFFEQ